MKGKSGWVLFNFGESDSTEACRKNILEILESFLLRNDNDSEINKQWFFNHGGGFGWNSENGLSGVIKGERMDHVKMYLNDDTSSLEPGILFTDHSYLDDTIERVQMVADAFEEFLKDSKITFKRNDR